MKLPRLSLFRVVVFGAVLLVGYLVFTVAQDVLLSQRLNEEEQRLHREIAELQRQERELEAIRDYLRTDEYVEGVARRVLGLVRPGETLVIVNSTAAQEPTPTPGARDGTPAPWWQQIFGE